MSLTTGVPAATFAAVLAGERTTKGVPVAAAEALLERLFARDPDAAVAAVANDDRATITGRLDALSSGASARTVNSVEAVVELMVSFAATAALMKAPLPAKVSRVLAELLGHVAEDDVDLLVSAALLLLTGALAEEAAPHARLVFGVEDDLRLLSIAGDLVSSFTSQVTAALIDALVGEVAPTPRSEPQGAEVWARARCATIAALVHRSGRHSSEPAVQSVGADTLRETLRWLCGQDLSATTKVGSSRATVHELAARTAAACHAAGVDWFGSRSICEMAGVTAPELEMHVDADDGVVDLLVAAAFHADCTDVATSLCVAATGGGAVRRRLAHANIARMPSLPPAVALACRPRLTGSGERLRAVEMFARVCADEWGHGWAERDVLAALDGDEAFSTLLSAALPAVANRPLLLDRLPAYLVDRSCATTPLAMWLQHPPTVARLCSAAAQIGVDRWAVLLSLAGSFTGTVDELVELTAEVAPAA